MNGYRIPKPNVKRAQGRHKRPSLFSRIKGRIFKKSEKKYLKSVRSPRKKSGYIRQFVPLFKYVGIPFLFLFVGGILFFSAKLVIDLRKSSAADIKGTFDVKEKVVGLDELPAYPGSKFAFSDPEKDPSIKQFLSSGQSVYTLPLFTSAEDVYKYYNTVLPTLGWNFIQSVPRGTPNRMHGEYWVRGEYAVRIYLEVEDIWYQEITPAQANNGMEDIVSAEKEKDLILSSISGSSLLPNYPWKLKVPSEYIVRYYDTKIDEKRGVHFRSLESDDEVLLEPIGNYNDKDVYILLEEFLKRNQEEPQIKEIKTGEESKKIDWRYKINSSSFVDVREIRALKADVRFQSTTMDLYILLNPRDNNAYALLPKDNKSAFKEFILQNLVAKTQESN